MKFKNFTGRVFTWGRAGLFFLLMASIYACKKDNAPGPPTSLTQMTSGITIVHADTSLTLTWNPGLAAWEGEDIQTQVQYEVQVSGDSTFSETSRLAYSGVIDSTFLFLGEEQITPLEIYFARVRTLASTGSGHSGWFTTARFHILDELPDIDLFRTIKVGQLIDQAIILNWESHRELTRLVVAATDGSDEHEFDLTNAGLTTMQVEGLLPGQDYTARLFWDTRPMGMLAFTTKPSVDGAGYIDLRASSDPMVLQNTLNTVPAGSTIVLQRGMTYTITETFKLDRDVTIMSAPGFGRQAHILMSSSFDVAEGSQIDLIRFEDVEITGEMASTYVFNLSPASTIKKIEFEACLISDQRGVLRLKDAGLKAVTDYVINNSIVQNIHDYGLMAIDHVDATVNNIWLTNSTVINARWIVRYNSSVVNHLNAMTVENATFFQAPNDNRYVLDMARTGSTIGSFIARNTLFGYTAGGRSFNSRTPSSVTGANSFATSDAIWGTSATQGLAAAGIVHYSATSEQVFAAPDNTNFVNSDLTIIDESLFNVGDPRWRP